MRENIEVHCAEYGCRESENVTLEKIRQPSTIKRNDFGGMTKGHTKFGLRGQGSEFRIERIRVRVRVLGFRV